MGIAFQCKLWYNSGSVVKIWRSTPTDTYNCRLSKRKQQHFLLTSPYYYSTQKVVGFHGSI